MNEANTDLDLEGVRRSEAALPSTCYTERTKKLFQTLPHHTTLHRFIARSYQTIRRTMQRKHDIFDVLTSKHYIN